MTKPLALVILILATPVIYYLDWYVWRWTEEVCGALCLVVGAWVTRNDWRQL